MNDFIGKRFGSKRCRRRCNHQRGGCAILYFPHTEVGVVDVPIDIGIPIPMHGRVDGASASLPAEKVKPTDDSIDIKVSRDRTAFHGAHVNAAADRPGEGKPPLVEIRWKRKAHVARIDRRAACQQGMGFGWSAVVGQWADYGIERLTKHIESPAGHVQAAANAIVRVHYAKKVRRVRRLDNALEVRRCGHRVIHNGIWQTRNTRAGSTTDAEHGAIYGIIWVGLHKGHVDVWF